MRTALGVPRPTRLGALLALLVALGLPLQSAHSAEKDYGWWYQANVGIGATPPPSNAPEDGLYIAGSSLNPIATSALRITGKATGGTLRLEIASASGTVAVVICPVTSPWRPAQAGAWAERPAHDCQRGSSRGTVAADGSAVSFTVPTSLNLEADDIYDLAVLPDPNDPAAFELALKPPGPAALTASTRPAESDPSPSASSPTSDRGDAAGPSTQAGSEAADPAQPLPSGDAVAAAPVAAPLGSAPDIPAVAAAPTLSTSSKASWGERMLVVGVLFAVVDGLWLLSYRRRHGGPGNDDDVGLEGGIGRFVQPRHQPPARI